jgi:hypothetical protein
MSAFGATMRISATPSVENTCQAERDSEPVESLLGLENRQRIEQALRGMRHAAFTGRQHAAVRLDVRRDEAGYARFGIADHEHVHVAGFERVDGVEHALALHARGELDFEIHDVGAEPLGRELERHSRARRGLGEEVGHGDAGQRIVLDGRLADGAHEFLRAREQGFDLRAGQAFQREQVPQGSVGSRLGSHVLVIVLVRTSVPG